MNWAMMPGIGFMPMYDAINESEIFSFLDKNSDLKFGHVFSARDDLMEEFGLDRSTATILISKYLRMRSDDSMRSL